jgi:serine/threonine-protein kinase
VPSAQALGRATGARLVLFGGLLAAGDSVRASVVLLDARTGERRLELERRDVPSRVDRLADSVAVAVLRELGRERGTSLARAASAPTESMSALKAYLQGEQFYRAARWDSAQAHFERAIAEDSTFALAYHRLATILRWRDAGQLPDSTPYLLMLRASRFTTWLAPRERVLAAADSGAAETYFAWRRTLAEPRTHVDLDGYVARLRAQLERDLRAYPDDAELWFLLAETRARYDRHVEVGDADDRATLALFDRAIALDSSFAPAYLGALPVVAYLDGAPGARRYIRTYLEREPGGAGPRDDRIRLADALLDPERAEAIDFRRLVDTLPPDALCEAAGLLQHAADSTDVVVRLARALVARASTRAANAPAVPACAVEPAIAGLLFRGHLRDADRLSALERHQSHAVVRMDLARFGVLPTLIARAELRDVLTRLPYVTDPRLYVWWAADGDTAAIATYARLFDSVSARAPKETFAPSWRASAASGHAFLALARRDTAEALRRFASTRDTTGACRYTARGTHAQLLLAKHRDDDAADLLARLWPGASNCHDGVDDVLWTLARARASDRLGRRVEAMVNYTLVADAWRTADPELQSYVREARAALVRLRRGPA